MVKFFTLSILLCFLGGCGGITLGTALAINTGGTVVGNAIWHKIKEAYPEDFPDSVENISDAEKTALIQKLKEMNNKYLHLIKELEKDQKDDLTRKNVP